MRISALHIPELTFLVYYPVRDWYNYALPRVMDMT